ncbi:MAG: low molecular weight phosphotyrosine protein phosphatase [Sulfuricella denitrificans]|nr:low molecular weight phosphotyrosine protein phosphatase [Sulfuricella denitrificans]
MKETSVLFVCMGNICRSPTAEGVFRDLVTRSGLDKAIHVDSAGTHNYHIGKSPDARASAAAAQRGYDLSALRGRQVSREDFLSFDYILAMDEENLSNLKRICPAGQVHKISLFLEYSRKFSEREVPDPYYGGVQGFEQVLEMVEDAAQGLLDNLAEAHSLRS